MNKIFTLIFARQPKRHRTLYFALLWGLLFMALLTGTAMPRSTDNLIQSRSGKTKTRIVSVPGFARFQLRGSNGYRILVWGSSRGVELVAARRHEAAAYLDRKGMVRHHSIRGRFGGFGRIDLRFHPTKKAFSDKKLKRCDVRGEPFYDGYFTGIFSFRGETNYTSVRQQKIHGLAGGPLTLKCDARPRKSASLAMGSIKSSGGSKLEASSNFGSSGLLVSRTLIVGRDAMTSARLQEKDGMPLNLSALPRIGVPYLVESSEYRPRLLINRMLVAKGPPNGFLIGPDGKNATVAPPRPFSGKAEYRGCSPPLEWRGTLKVSLPGLTDIALTGKRFFALLTPQTKCTTRDR